MKKFISVILTILLLILGIDFICSAASDLSSMSNCRFIFAESNKSGSYLYGYNGKNIYSAKYCLNVVYTKLAVYITYAALFNATI